MQTLKQTMTFATLLAAVALLLAACGGAGAPAESSLAALTPAGSPAAGQQPPAGEEVRERAREYIHHYQTISLTGAQKAVRDEALSALPAPCCSQFTMATCCCECNLAKSVWGMANQLIVEEGAGVEAVRAAAEEWIETMNPDGFSGKSCFNGGCQRSFEHDGCGGMDASRVH